MKHTGFFIFCGLYTLCTYSQNSITGIVTNNSDNEPLEQVNIFFPELEKGAITNAAGAFAINDLPSGNYQLVASSLGFLTYATTIEIPSKELNIALTPSVIEMEEVIVSTPFHQLQRDNVMKVEQATVAEFKTLGAPTLAQGISTIAGVSSVSTGMGIGKPVIRGLSANRVLVYAQGIRLENQQFGDEHGLGVNDAGIESVEVIKGPASLLYGSDALGGVLYLNPEKFALAGKTEGDVNFDYFSNSQGISTNAGIKTSSEKFKFLVRGSIASHIDYETGDGQRVTNSRFSERDFKSGMAYQGSNFKTELRYNFNNSDLGIPEEIGEQTTTRSPNHPFQEITSHILSSKTNIFLKNSSLELTLGGIFNDRKEFEEGEEGAALAMNLNTYNYNLQYNLPKGEKLETIIGLQGMHQTNTNSGEEVLIPNAITNDIGVLMTSHLHLGADHDIQFGVRYDHRSIGSEENGMLTEEGYIAALDREYNSFNAALGYKIDLSKNITGRINTATGFRAPNLAELTSNGVHEGTNRFEIGNPNLSNERNFQVDVALEYKNEHVEFFINVFHNTINDYIFIEPNGSFIDTDAVFLYMQQNAKLYGSELGFHLHPHPLDWLHLESTFESVIGKLNNGDYLPLIPANNWTNTLRIEFDSKDGWLKSKYAFITFQSFFDQNNNSLFEVSTDGYNLLSLGFGGTCMLFKNPIAIRVSGNNLLNEAYVSHLSRLKTDGIANIGRNINLGVSIPF
jgi:iron complex outermembrane receptor protein